MAPTATRFLLGTHHPDWLARTNVPLFVSHRTLSKRVALPRAMGRWALDSGGFSELSMYGRWQTTPAQYIDAVKRYQREVGGLEWCAPQDWMCEPVMLKRTGLTVEEHQRRSVRSVVELRSAGLPVIPVLQGWSLGQYWDCVELYERAGIALKREPLVGLGTVCRRQGASSGATIGYQLGLEGLRLHGFGFKTTGLTSVCDLVATLGGAIGGGIVSADSMAWSFAARYDPPLPGHRGMHVHCNNCIDYAMAWREALIDGSKGCIR
jgi:hypothetical protein